MSHSIRDRVLLVRRFAWAAVWSISFVSPWRLDAQESGRLTNDQVVGALRESLARFDAVDLTASIHVQSVDHLGSNAETVVESTALRVSRQVQRALISMKSKTDRPAQDSWLMQNDFIVYDNDDVLSCQAGIDLSLAQVKGVNDDLGFLLYSARLAGEQRLDRQSVYGNLNDSGAALWIIGYAPLSDYLDGPLGPVVNVTEDGAEIEAASAFGLLTAKLSKSHGWLPKSFRIEKNREHKTVGGLVGDVYASETGVGVEQRVTSVTWTGKIDSFVSDDAGRWAPKRMTVTRTTNAGKTLIGSIVTTIDLEQVTFNPSLTELDFHTDIVAPLGYPVTVNNATHLPYKWDGTGAAPGVPIDPQRLIEGVAEPGNGKRILLILANVALVLVLIVLLWRKRGAA